MTDVDGTPVDYQGNAVGRILFDPVEYVRHSFLIAFDKAVQLGILHPAELSLAEWALDSVSAFAGEKPVLVNGDYTPGNWLVDENGIHGSDLNEKAVQCAILRVGHALYNLVYGTEGKSQRLVELGRSDLERIRHEL